MTISPVTAGAILSTIVTGIASAISVLHCEARASRYERISLCERQFRVSWRGYFIPSLCVGLACFLLIDSRGTQYQGWFTFFIAWCAFLGGVYIAQANARSVVAVEGGAVKYIEAGRERWTISLEDVLGVTTYQWNFLIRARWRVDEPIMLPMHFADAPILLATLRHFRPGKTRNDPC